MSEKTKILVIDDDPDIHAFCTLVLEGAGYAVTTAASAAEGRAALAAVRPDLVILDVMMEQADAGFEAAQWFASEHPGLPVLMLSSIADAADSLFDTSSLGVADLVNKPIAPEELLAKVKRLLARRAKAE
ncbi:MAG: response regulator transcription factor [Thermoanaerobaculaceae bacterium]